MKKLLLLAALAFALSGCMRTVSDDLVGTWLRPDPNRPDKTQGFTLHKGGHAVAINIPKVTYRTWYVSDDNLVLAGQDASNGTPLLITDTYEIHSVNDSMLVLISPSREMLYFAREK